MWRGKPTTNEDHEYTNGLPRSGYVLSRTRQNWLRPADATASAIIRVFVVRIRGRPGYPTRIRGRPGYATGIRGRPGVPARRRVGPAAPPACVVGLTPPKRRDR